MNKHVYLGLSILELSKILIYEVWFDYVISKCEEKENMFYMDTDTFTVFIKTQYLQR